MYILACAHTFTCGQVLKNSFIICSLDLELAQLREFLHPKVSEPESLNSKPGPMFAGAAGINLRQAEDRVGLFLGLRGLDCLMLTVHLELKALPYSIFRTRQGIREKKAHGT